MWRKYYRKVKPNHNKIIYSLDQRKTPLHVYFHIKCIIYIYKQTHILCFQLKHTLSKCPHRMQLYHTICYYNKRDMFLATIPFSHTPIPEKIYIHKVAYPVKKICLYRCWVWENVLYNRKMEQKYFTKLSLVFFAFFFVCVLKVPEYILKINSNKNYM